MKPQHLLIAAPLALSSIANVGVEAFGASPSNSKTFLGSQINTHVNMESSFTMDSEGTGIDKQTRATIERKLAEASYSLDRSFLQSSSDAPFAEQNVAAALEKAKSEHGMPWTDTIGNTEQENPLLYMNFWKWQLDFMQDTLTNLRPDACAMEEYGYMDNKDKKARIVNQCYQSDEYRKIRMTYYDAGDNTQVFNSVWYPDPAYNLPVLGIDLLAFNRKKYLAIVDFQPIHEEESDHATTYEDRLKPIKEKYETLQGRMSSKFYDETQFFSQQMLFARFDDEEVVHNELFPAFKQYVKLHTDIVSETEADETRRGQEAILEKQRSYDTYSAERDPATGLFAAMFGKEWADDFVFNFLFSLSDRKEGGLEIPMMFGGGGGPGGPPKPAAQSSKEEKSRPFQHSK